MSEPPANDSAAADDADFILRDDDVVPSILHLQDVFTWRHFKEHLQFGGNYINLCASDDILRQVNETAWQELAVLKARSEEYTARACTRLGKRAYSTQMNVVEAGAQDIVKYLQQRMNVLIFCSQLEKGNFFCLEYGQVTISCNSSPTEHFTMATFVPMAMQQTRTMSFLDFIAPMERLHKIPSDMLQFLRGSDSDWGDQIRKRETRLLKLHETPEKIADIVMRQTEDGGLLFFMVIKDAAFEGNASTMSCPFCRKSLAIDLCNLQSLMLAHKKQANCAPPPSETAMETAMETDMEKQKQHCCICHDELKFEHPWSCQHILCYECVWKYAAKQQDVHPILLDQT